MTTQTKAADLRAKSQQELQEALVELRKEAFGLRMKRSTGGLSDTASFKKIRREVARIKTVMNEQKKAES